MKRRVYAFLQHALRKTVACAVSSNFILLFDLTLHLQASVSRGPGGLGNSHHHSRETVAMGPLLKLSQQTAASMDSFVKECWH
jgi:hypothetical protein